MIEERRAKGCVVFANFQFHESGATISTSTRTVFPRSLPGYRVAAILAASLPAAGFTVALG